MCDIANRGRESHAKIFVKTSNYVRISVNNPFAVAQIVSLKQEGNLASIKNFFF